MLLLYTMVVMREVLHVSECLCLVMYYIVLLSEARRPEQDEVLFL